MKKINLLVLCLLHFCIQAGTLMAEDLAMLSNQIEEDSKVGGVKSLDSRIQHLENTIKRQVEGNNWFDRIQLNGLIEIEGGYMKTDFNDLELQDEGISDVDLTTVELDVDAKIADHIDGHFVVKYEEDELFIDEGSILLVGSDSCPVYLIAGKQYLPFGNYESAFVTDPTTLLLGETNEGAAVAGYCFEDDLADFSMGIFNGKAKEAGEEDTINSVVAGLVLNPIENLMMGVSYTSNIAGSDAFSDVVVDPDNLDSLVGGWSVFVSYQFLERFKVTGEYVGSVDSFKAGEIYSPEDTQARQPSAWNLELGMLIQDNLEVAVCYEGSDDGGESFLPESQYGAVLNWGLFENTNLAFEYLHGEFEDNFQKTDSCIAQFAIEF